MTDGDAVDAHVFAEVALHRVVVLGQRRRAHAAGQLRLAEVDDGELEARPPRA